MRTQHFADGLEKLSACSEAVIWARTQPDADAAWQSCQRGDWMLWLCGKLDTSAPYSPERRPLVAASCACARLAWGRMPEQSRTALNVFERWSAGEDIPVAELRTARNAAAYAAYAAAYAAAAYAADAAYAAAAYAAAAYAAAAYAAYAAYAADARKKTLARCADIVREHYPTAPVLP